jgi:hypothetical protein
MSFRTRDNIHNFGLGIGFPLGIGELSVTAAGYHPNCPRNDCPGHFMASVEYEQRLVRAALGRPDQSGSFALGIRTGVAIATPNNATLFSGLASLQLSLVPSYRGLRLYPFLTPGLGFGLVTSGRGSDAGMLPVLGAGVGLLTPDDRLGAVAGVQRAFLRGGNWLAGLGLRVSLRGHHRKGTDRPARELIPDGA